jgi:hypothetical protein
LQRWVSRLGPTGRSGRSFFFSVWLLGKHRKIFAKELEVMDFVFVSFFFLKKKKKKKNRFFAILVQEGSAVGCFTVFSLQKDRQPYNILKYFFAKMGCFTVLKSKKKKSEQT